MQKGSNEVVLINGATSGVGEDISLSFAKTAKLVVTGRDKDKIDAIVSKVKAIGGEAIGVAMDPANAGHVKEACKQALDKFGKIDVLVNNLDVSSAKKVQDLTDSDWSESISSSLNPMFYFCREVIPAMREKRYGRIINIGSLYYLGWPGMANRSAANSAIFGFTRSMALEVANDNITSNCIAVGDLASAGQSESEVAGLTASIPTQRLGSPEDVGNAVAFLASKSSKYITGQTLFVCGGKSIHFSMSV